MKTLLVAVAGLSLFTLVASAAPLKVALLEFDDATGAKPDAAVAGAINTQAFAKKGADLLSKALLQQKDFVVIDRRDFIAQLEQSSPKELVQGRPRPGFIQAAQLLNADAVIGGSLSSFSTSKEKVSQGGYNTELTKISMRVTLRAQDVIDGAVIAVADASAEESFRQTDSMKTEMGEEEFLKMMEKALAKAVPQVVEALAKRQAGEKRPKVTVSIEATENPALVEIDGILVGTTPVVGLEIYQGDHTLTISRPAYETMAKRIVLDKDLKISVPMFRTALSADEKKAILEKADMKAYLFEGKPDMLIQEIHE